MTEGSSFYEMTSVTIASENMKIPRAYMLRHNAHTHICIYICHTYCLPIYMLYMYYLHIYIYIFANQSLVRLENKTVIRYIFENCQVP